MKHKLEQKVAKLEQELREVKVELGKRKCTGLKVRDTFELIEKKWKILDLNENGAFCLCMESLGDKTFDSKCNEWTSSNLRDSLST